RLTPTDRMIGIWRNRKKDGTVFDAEVLSTEVTILTRRARLALLNDVTERLRGDRHRATEIGVTRVLIDAKSFAEAAPQAIAAICQAEEWALGDVWLYDAAAAVLGLAGARQAAIGSRLGQIFARDKVEASRRASVEAFQKASHASPVPMAISSLHDGRFVEANLQFLRLFGSERADVVGRSSLELEMWVDQQ